MHECKVRMAPPNKHFREDNTFQAGFSIVKLKSAKKGNICPFNEKVLVGFSEPTILDMSMFCV